MIRVTLDQDGQVTLPHAFRHRLQLEAGEELLLEETGTALVLHLLRPTINKVYVELTTRCNLHCRTCVRNVWAEPQQDMTADTFECVIQSL
ncbi:MAG: hypothetical protein H5T69_10040, partial [Chloroflexi bacterium]|nr:hypothetical protein [Chloroflexota bacterium]